MKRSLINLASLATIERARIDQQRRLNLEAVITSTAGACPTPPIGSFGRGRRAGNSTPDVSLVAGIWDYLTGQSSNAESVKSNGGRTGWPPGLLQDDSRPLSRWLAEPMNARLRAGGVTVDHQTVARVRRVEARA